MSNISLRSVLIGLVNLLTLVGFILSVYVVTIKPINKEGGVDLLAKEWHCTEYHVERSPEPFKHEFKICDKLSQ